MTSDNLLSRTIQYKKRNGTIDLFQTIADRLLRKILPFKSYANANGVKLPDSHFPSHVRFESYLSILFSPDEPNAQFGEVYAHRNYTQKGDDVVIVGGGRGISTVVAARSVGASGSVTVYEPSIRFSNITHDVVELNDVVDIVDINDHSVGPELAVFEDSMGKNITSDELPECDILELDCEMAELKILKNMTIKPETIIVEIHNGYEFDGQTILDLLSDKGYTVKQWITENNNVSESEFREVLKIRENNEPSSTNWKSPPQVIVKNE